MARKIYVIPELCNGCRMCEMVCSFVNTREFNPRHSKIKVAKVDEEGFSVPVVDCDGVNCAKKSSTRIPPCVEMCTTGALIFAERDEAARMNRELIIKRAEQPVFKVIAPWKYPFPWRKWPFSEEAK